MLPESRLLRPQRKEKMSLQMSIHSPLALQHGVVGARGHELYAGGAGALLPPKITLEPHRRRKAKTQPGVRRYLQHMVLGCQYPHPNQVIHWDLRLGKLLLNDDLEVKIGDLARQPKVNMMGSRRRKPCLNTQLLRC